MEKAENQGDKVEESDHSVKVNSKFKKRYEQEGESCGMSWKV